MLHAGFEPREGFPGAPCWPSWSTDGNNEGLSIEASRSRLSLDERYSFPPGQVQPDTGVDKLCLINTTYPPPYHFQNLIRSLGSSALRLEASIRFAVVSVPWPFGHVLTRKHCARSLLLRLRSFPCPRTRRPGSGPAGKAPLRINK